MRACISAACENGTRRALGACSRAEKNTREYVVNMEAVKTYNIETPIETKQLHQLLFLKITTFIGTKRFCKFP